MMESFGMTTATVVATCLFIGLGFQTCHGASWSYTGSHGVDHWATDYPGQCDGQRQSPIDLESGKTMYDKQLQAFSFTGFNSAVGVSWTLSNNGHTVQVTYTAGDLLVNGGSLGDTYRVAQFHFHWGSDNTKGSEHTVDGGAYPMEVHVVCFNTRYADLSTAVTHEDGLAVLGFFFQISANENPTVQKLVQFLPQVMYAGNQTVISAFPLNDMLAGMGEYYRYKGGLTTPTCNEVVTWTVFKNTIKLSNSQMQAFRALKDGDDAAMVNNFRPVQLLFDRTITASFEDEKFAGGSNGLVFNSLALISSLVLSLWFRL